ncbi:tetratricopeptide repeat-containing diguanylate cyclase [Roseibium aggregatum]|uniref:tetratricopeptide repeat-containing diguanylate cyclase n=1 Tax=Roseibium aggregatum TaxID=187304 RepID=UPI0025AD8E95|nr:tetratricopeptide repeat-containing diguanylate cyclase [Roseibium aggregatum]WJS01251.1 diguanylate cyclase [Roseibium aggregatum]
MRWRNPAFCKRLLYDALKRQPETDPGNRPLQFNLAWLERWSGHFDAAAKLADKAFSMMDPRQDPEGWSELLVIKSVCVYSLGELSQADAILGESLEILGAATHGRAGIEPLTVLANMCAYYHDYEKAQSKLQEAMDIADRLGLVYERSHILQTLSRTELRCGSPDAAVEAAKACLEDALEHRNAVNLPYAYEVLGAALVETGALKEARACAAKGLAAAQFSQDHRVACHLYYVLGLSLFEEKRYDEARAELENGLLNAAGADYHHWTRNFYLKLSQTHEALEEHRSALDYLKAYVKLQKKMFTEETERQSNDFRNRLEFRLAHSKADYERELRTRTETLNTELQEANTSLLELNAQIEFNALHDALTGVGNRRMMSKFFETTRLSVGPGVKVAAILIDLDRFKTVNDHHGHSVGDQVIKAVAERLSDLLQQDETIIRMGGDEFLILSTRRTDADSLSALADRIVYDINLPIPIKGAVDRTVGASVGVSVQANGPDLEYELLRTADEAMYQAKKTGRNRSCLHSSVPLSIPQNAS